MPIKKIICNVIRVGLEGDFNTTKILSKRVWYILTKDINIDDIDGLPCCQVFCHENIGWEFFPEIKTNSSACGFLCMYFLSQNNLSYVSILSIIISAVSFLSKILPHCIKV